MDTPHQVRYATLDAWRGLACLMVIAFHSVAGTLVTPTFVGQIAAEGGSSADWLLVLVARFWIGVPFFFVISGYCIAAAADSARRRPRPARTFFIRRLRRIYPPLWGFLLIAAILVAVLPKLFSALGVQVLIPYSTPTDVPFWQWFGSITLTEEWRHHVAGPQTGYFIGHIWTLCYEEQFYLVSGLIVAFAPRWLFPAALAVTLFVVLKLSGAITLPFGTDGTFLDGLWLAFAAGGAVYYRANVATPSIRRCIDLGLVAGTIWGGTHVADWWTFPQTLPAFLFAAFPAALLLGWLQPFDELSKRVALLTPLRWCGMRCYSLYLVHGPIANLVSYNLYHAGVTGSTATVLITMPACLAASLLAGWAFYRWVEVRFHNPQLSAAPINEPARLPPATPLPFPQVVALTT